MICTRLLWAIAFDAHDKQAEREGTADIPETAVIGLARKALGDDEQKAREFCVLFRKAGRVTHCTWAGVPMAGGCSPFPHRTFQEYLAGCSTNNNFWELAPDWPNGR